MATLKEYFEKDGSRTLTSKLPLPLIDSSTGKVLLEVEGKIHIDFEANAQYVSFYIPKTDKVQCPSRLVLNSVNTLLERFKRECQVRGGFVGENPMSSTEMMFTGRIFIYSEYPITQEDRTYIDGRAKELGHSVQFRLNSYAQSRSEWETPLAFISHDSRDKDQIARPLAIELQKLLCPVWYDEFTVKIGDSLRASIEKGLKECKRCIFIVTQNFLANGGWAKREYDAIFTRELLEKENLILPVWFNVTQKDVYEYSPSLADRKAIHWKPGLEEEVAREIEPRIRA